MAQRGRLLALRTLLLLCIASSCSPHDWFSTPARAPGSGGVSAARHASGSPLQRLYLDYHSDRHQGRAAAGRGASAGGGRSRARAVVGEELRRAGAHQRAAGAAGPGRREGRRRTLASAQNAANPAGSRGGVLRAATAGNANASASASPRMDRGAGAAAGTGKIGGRGRTGAVELGKRGRRRQGAMMRKRRGGGESPDIVVAGVGLEEAVVGEPAEVIVEVSGWSKVCAEWHANLCAATSPTLTRTPVGP
jgi:hypothetical protein